MWKVEANDNNCFIAACEKCLAKDLAPSSTSVIIPLIENIILFYKITDTIIFIQDQFYVVCVSIFKLIESSLEELEWEASPGIPERVLPHIEWSPHLVDKET